MKAEQFLETFVEDASDHIRDIRRALLSLEQDGFAADTHQECLRRAHNLKGSAQVFGLEGIAGRAHALEDLLAGVDKDPYKLTSELLDQALKATDELEAQIQGALESGELLQRLVATLDGLAPKPAAEEPRERPAPPRRGTVRTSVARLDRLANLLGELLAVHGGLTGQAERLRELTSTLEPLSQGLRGQPAYPETKALLDGFCVLGNDLEQDLVVLQQLLGSLHSQALELRLLPLATITEDLPRMARDLGKEHQKPVELVISGQDVELDRGMLDAVKPMLLHMVRNAVDHGIESAAERSRAGKPQVGRIELQARYEGGLAVICLRDDGRGIRADTVREAAIRGGLISADEAAAMSDEEAVHLIMRPGFSTRDYITDVSGRGVGMDVVKSTMDQVKGNLAILSTPGRGTEMVLRLPLTMAVIAGLLVECEGETYGIPLHYVVEVLGLAEDELFSEGGREVIRSQGRMVPLVALQDILGLESAREQTWARRMTAVVISFGGQARAFLVSRSLGTRELLVKKLGDQLKSLQFFSGATLLADGTPALILSVPDLYEARGASLGPRLRRELETRKEQASRGRVLVVDDSITTRTMEKNILEAHQYEVEVAISGVEALAKLDAGHYDLVVTDIEMPEMDGFELTRQMRQDERTAQLPVVVVSSRSSDEDRRKGLEVGAQAYIVKSSFDQGKLVDTVRTLIG